MSAPYNPYGGASNGYVPTQFQTPGTASFWGVLIDQNRMPSELFSRLSDSIYFYLDANAECQYRNSGYIEPDKAMWWSQFTQHIHQDQAAAHYVVKYAMSSLYDACAVPYQIVSTPDGKNIPILDRQAFLHSLISTCRVDPTKFLQKLNKSIATFGLIDPATDIPFPGLIPATALPPVCDWQAQAAFHNWQMTVGMQYRTHAIQKQQKMAGRKKLFGSAVHMLSGGLSGNGLGGFGGGSTGTGF